MTEYDLDVEAYRSQWQAAHPFSTPPWDVPGEPEDFDDDNTVPDGLSCPTCGENDIDLLMFTDDDGDNVECQTCGAIYYISDPDEDDEPE